MWAGFCSWQEGVGVDREGHSHSTTIVGAGGTGFCNTESSSGKSFSPQMCSNSWRMTQSLREKHKNGLHPFLNQDFVFCIQDDLKNNQKNAFWDRPRLGDHHIQGTLVQHCVTSHLVLYSGRVGTPEFRFLLPTHKLCGLDHDEHSLPSVE